MFLAGWFLLPYYAIRGAGRRALLPLLAFVALIVIGYILGAVVLQLLTAGE